MRVAVFLFPPTQEPESSSWVQQFIQQMATCPHIAHLLVYTNNENVARLQFRNLEVITVNPALAFWSRWMQQRRWRRHLAAQQVQVVFSFGLRAVFASHLPHVLYLDEGDLGRPLFSKRKKLQQFRHILVANNRAKEKVLSLPGSAALPVSVQPGAPPPQYLKETDNQLVKDRFTDGAEYFFYNGPLHATGALMHLLKAFSRFKRRQKSGWKLVLVQESTPVPGPLEQLLSNYKYRGDVITPGAVSPEVVQSLYAAAYCFVQPALPAYFGTRLLQALSWGLPLIATPECRDWAGNSALYFDPEDEEGLAEHLMTLYKDETLRSRLAAAAAERAAQFSWAPLVETILKSGTGE